ncbi:MAG: TolB family protein [Gemmatimonadota bacterium]
MRPGSPARGGAAVTPRSPQWGGLRSRPAAGLLAFAFAALGWTACREAAEPFRPPDPLPPGDVRRLTFSEGEDRSPVWSPSGDSVFYSAEGFGHLPLTDGVLVTMPREGGVAQPLLPTVQLPTGAPRMLVTPAVAPGGARVAYAQVISILDSGVLCESGAVECLPEGETELPPAPRLSSVVLRVRAFAATGPIDEDPALEVSFPGRFLDTSRHPGGLEGVFVIDYFPFQRLFDEETVLPFRPSWSPAGDRLVFSDGLGLLVWSLADGSVVPVANTQDGVSPAWSPDGEWIAFSRLERIQGVDAMCEYFTIDPRTGGRIVSCVEERTDYRIARRVITLIHPDGSDPRELGEGDEPAWSPDGGTIFFRRAGRIWRIGRDGSAESPMSGTEGGREPAVSPDGTELAFARADAAGRHDIWVVRIAP